MKKVRENETIERTATEEKRGTGGNSSKKDSAGEKKLLPGHSPAAYILVNRDFFMGPPPNQPGLEQAGLFLCRGKEPGDLSNPARTNVTGVNGTTDT